MKLILFLACCMALAGRGGAQTGGMAQVAIVDRDSGAVLVAHYYRGEYWVAGTPGARYAIEIHNGCDERVLAVASVDGVNVISGATAGWDQTGYVFDSGQSYQITGWRKSDARVAAFTFTASRNSYAERTGRGGNVGVIGVALFRERPRVAEVSQYAGLASAAPQAPLASAGNAASAAPSVKDENTVRDSNAPRTDAARVISSLPAPILGTGHGAREFSYVTRTDFQRRQSRPDELIRIRYDSLDHLLAMGIVTRPLPPAPGINAFPASPDPQYVPDPAG